MKRPTYGSRRIDTPERVLLPCSQCGKRFPEAMLWTRGHSGEYCAICSLELAGCPPNQTDHAIRLYAEAVDHLKRTGQWEDKSDGQ